MTEKLTLEIAMKYHKATFKYRENEHHFVVYPSLINLILSNPNYELQNVIIDSIIQLRPLSSLTDEEKENYYKLCDKSEMLGFDYNDKVYIITGQSTNDYLRSINIDIDGLQERGVAVYE